MADQMCAVVRSDSLRDELHFNAYREFTKLTWDNASHKLLHIYNRQVSYA